MCCHFSIFIHISQIYMKQCDDLNLSTTLCKKLFFEHFLVMECTLSCYRIVMKVHSATLGSVHAVVLSENTKGERMFCRMCGCLCLTECSYLWQFTWPKVFSRQKYALQLVTVKMKSATNLQRQLRSNTFLVQQWLMSELFIISRFNWGNTVLRERKRLHCRKPKRKCEPEGTAVLTNST